MAQASKFAWVGVVAILAAAAGAVLMTGVSDGQIGNAQNRGEVSGPLISRGYTEAPAGTAVIAGDPLGGDIVLELRIAEGQEVQRNQIVAVLNNYPKADIDVRRREAELTKAQQQRETMVSGYRTSEIAQQEVSVKAASEESRLKDLELSRSSAPPDQKQLQSTIAQQSLEREQAKLKYLKDVLAADLAQIESEITIIKARLDAAKLERESSLVRSPLDGVVVDIYTRAGERIFPYKGIAKIVDLNQIRIFADVDEIHLRSLKLGGKVEFTFQGSRTAHVGTIVRTPLTIKRSKRSEADLGEQNTRLVEVEIKPDNPSGMPLMLGREARVTFE